MARRQSTHRQSVERTVIEGDVKRANRGQILGFIVAMTIVLGGVALLWQGKSITGLITLVGGMTGLGGDLCLRSAKGAKARRGRTPVTHTLRAVRHNNPRARSRGAQPAVSCGFVGQPRRGKGGAPALVCGSWCRAVFLRPEVQELGTKEARSRIAPGLSSERTSGAGEGGAKPQ